MRIPLKTLSLYSGESIRKNLPENRLAELTVAPVRLDATLMHTADEQKQGHEEYLRREPVFRSSQLHSDGEERRVGERRKANYPVLLDTRLAHRRKSSSHSTINFEI